MSMRMSLHYDQTLYNYITIIDANMNLQSFKCIWLLLIKQRVTFQNNECFFRILNYYDILCGAENNVDVLWAGPSLVQDEASVVLTGIIQTTKKIRVMDHNEMSVLLVTQNKITNGTRKNNGFQLSYEAFG